MAAGNTELVDKFEQFFRNYYDSDIQELAQNYPEEQQALYVDWRDIYRFDPDLGDDFLNQAQELKQYAEEALRLYDEVDTSLGRAHVRVHDLDEQTNIGEIRSRHINQLVEITGTVDSIEQSQSALEEAAFECQLCGTLNRFPRQDGEPEEPYECIGCEQDGSFRLNTDKSEFIDTQTIFVEQQPVG